MMSGGMQLGTTTAKFLAARRGVEEFLVGGCGDGVMEGDVACCLVLGHVAEGGAVGEDDGAFVVSDLDADGDALVEEINLRLGHRRDAGALGVFV